MIYKQPILDELTSNYQELLYIYSVAIRKVNMQFLREQEEYLDLVEPDR